MVHKEEPLKSITLTLPKPKIARGNVEVNNIDFAKAQSSVKVRDFLANMSNVHLTPFRCTKEGMYKMILYKCMSTKMGPPS